MILLKIHICDFAYLHLLINYTMKKMTCEQLGGACSKEFHAVSFEEIAELSKKHGMEMFAQNEPRHLAAMSKMQELMKTPEALNQWLEIKRTEFNAQPDLT